MEDRAYAQANDERYGGQYEYQNISANEGDDDQNYCDYGAEDGGDYPIGDGQDIDAQFLGGEYTAEDDFTDYRAMRIPQRASKSLPANQSKYSSPYGLPRRGTILPQRTSAYFTNEVGDFRRASLTDKYILGAYPTHYTPETTHYSLLNTKRESFLRSITDKEYRARILNWRENRQRPDRRASGNNYYAKPAPLTHDQLQDTFMKNYKMDTRKPTQTTSAPPQVNKVSTSPRSDTAAMRDYYMRKGFFNRRLEKRGESGATKDTKSEPAQPKTTDDLKYMKPQSPREKSATKTSPRSVKTLQDYPKSINYEAFVKAAQNSTALETDVEVKYKNDDFDKSNQEDTDTGGQGRNISYQEDGVNVASSSSMMLQLKEQTSVSDDKLMSPIKEMAKLKISARSNRSRRSNHTVRSKKYDDLLKLQKSKCTVMSVIYDGIQKCEQSKYEFMPSSKYTKGDSQYLRTSKLSQTDYQVESVQDKSNSSSVDILHSEIIAKMFKEFRDYHLQNISQEVKRLQYLEVLPQKITQLHTS